MVRKIPSSKRMPIMILIVIGILGLTLGILSLLGGGRMEPRDTRNGIVWISTAWQKKNAEGKVESWISSGTGWAVGKPGKPVQYIITNAHVVEEPYLAAADPASDIKVYFSEAENDFTEIQVVYYSAPEENDIAILKLPVQTEKRIPLRLRNSDTVDIGESAFALGYPALAADGQQFSTYNTDDITMTRGVISKRVTPSGVAFDAFQMDVSVLGGNSGGPLVDLNGNVIGINTLSYEELGMSYAIEINELIKTLDAERIDYTVASAGLGSLPGWLSYVFLPLGILALAGGAFLLVQAQRSSAVVQETGSAPGKIIPAEGQGPVKKKAILRGVTGKFAGQTFDLEKGKVVIGRDPAGANIIFDESTAGISRRHCQIVYDSAEDSFRITDLGSSYGTFLGNGKKLPANVPEKLSAGDTFYLNNSSNRFLVTKE